MLTIHKYPFYFQDNFLIDMPHGAKILSAQLQDGHPVIWALVNDIAEKTPHRFSVRGTGHPCDDLLPAVFVATIQVPPSALVFHVFWRGAE